MANKQGKGGSRKITPAKTTKPSTKTKTAKNKPPKKKQVFNAKQKAHNAKVRAARNKSGKDTDYQAAEARGDVNVGSESKNAQANRARRARLGGDDKKTPKGKDVGHKTSLKSGGSNSTSNTRLEDSSANRSKGGKSGNKAGKASGGRKSKRGKQIK